MSDKANELVAVKQEELVVQPSYNEGAGFDLMQRMAKSLAASTIIPDSFRNNVANCIIAIEMANRMQVSPFLVMQEMYIIYGKPSFSSKFIISRINACGLFKENLKFKKEGSGNTLSCQAYTYNRNGEIVEGPKVDMKMAEGEGWLTKKDSKWKTMPEVMMMYRAASFFAKFHCPEILMGMKSVEEIEDAVVVEDSPKNTSVADEINDVIAEEVK